MPFSARAGPSHVVIRCPLQRRAALGTGSLDVEVAMDQASGFTLMTEAWAGIV